LEEIETVPNTKGKDPTAPFTKFSYYSSCGYYCCQAGKKY